MVIFTTLCYILFSACVIYPPIEFVSAGFTIPQLLDNFLGSENVNFIEYHIKRVTITALIHSALPLGYVLTLWYSGQHGQWMPCLMIASAIAPLIMMYKIASWLKSDTKKHPVVKALLPYVPPGMDWRTVAMDFNIEYRGIDKVSIQLNATSKFIATETWFIKVSQYSINLVKQIDCILVATETDSHNYSVSGEEEVQYLNIEAIPSGNTIKKFTFRISTTALRELQPRLAQAVRMPAHITLQPTLVERFVVVFNQFVAQNPVYYHEQDVELCIGCMQSQANVKINKRCSQDSPENNGSPCQQCNCRVLWCVSCLGRWWATRADGAPAYWLGQRGSCPVCRAPFCIMDVCRAARRTAR